MPYMDMPQISSYCEPTPYGQPQETDRKSMLREKKERIQKG